MVQNIGSKGRLLRVICGVYGMLLGFLFIQGAIGIIIGIVSLISLVSGMVGWCGLKALLDRLTKRTEVSDAEKVSPKSGAA